MRKLLLGTFAVLAAALPLAAQELSSPDGTSLGAPATAVDPPSIWLVLRYGAGGPGALEKIEMRDMAQCEMQGAIWESSKRLSEGGYTGFECMEGK